MYKPRKLLSQRHPFLYFLAVNYRRVQRKIYWLTDRKHYAHTFSSSSLPYRVKRHKSLLIRKLGDSDPQLQINKIVNLKIAVKQLNTITIHPGETFSFCRLVGLPTQKKGYQMGMELSFGKAKPGIGGGICQIANLINWLIFHSPLTIVQASTHSFDPFPDEGRVLPFGSGAAVFYNYVDYQFTNNTSDIYQINLWFTDKTIEGELRVSQEPKYSYHVFEKNHAFHKKEDLFFRQNEIWRNKIDRKTGNHIEEELLKKNYARVTYTPKEYEVLD